MALRTGCFAGGLALLSCFGCAERKDAGYPLLDGACGEYAGLGANAVPLPNDETLFVFQDQSYVWVCASLPPESFGVVDLVLNAPALDAPVNLHVSAQLGEWPAEAEDGAPDTAESDRWWRTPGWFAIPVRFNGHQGEGDTRRARFIPSDAREFQLSKARFGRGPWALRFKFDLVRSPNGDFESMTFPEDEASPLIIEAE